MLQLHERGMKIQHTIYNQACRLLCDDYEQVRSAAVQMVWVLSQLYPESIVPIPSSNEQVRLVDNSFGKISHMISDGSWVVRVQATKTLGNMLQVSPHFLEQTSGGYVLLMSGPKSSIRLVSSPRGGNGLMMLPRRRWTRQLST
ncbi:hypothetical protein J4Q44_G00329350 [Coregonus suidteri]|uniref:Integrator complex subunit 4 n=1 Tax=Coregonus suidteri TaxID=861788 RepID=A0AAN8QHG8_9TELE